MPEYKFVCDNCMNLKVLSCSISEYDKLFKEQICPDCGQQMHRKYDHVNIRFIGKGFYCTDYPKSIDKKTLSRITKKELPEMVKEAYKQIEEEEDESYSGYLYKDETGKTKFIDEKDAKEKSNTVAIKGKEYKVVN